MIRYRVLSNAADASTMATHDSLDVPIGLHKTGQWHVGSLVLDPGNTVGVIFFAAVFAPCSMMRTGAVRSLGAGRGDG